MAAEDLKQLRHIYDDWARGDFSGGTEMFADDVVVTTFDADGDEIELHGLAEFQRWFREFLEQWQHFRIEPVDLRLHGHRVFVAARQYATGATSGAELAMPVYAAWAFDEHGRVVEFHTSRHEDVARRKAGLDVR